MHVRTLITEASYLYISIFKEALKSFHALV